MPRQPLKLRPIRCVPHIHVAIITSSDQPCPIWAPGHATDPGRELTARPAPRGRCRCHIPHLHSLQIGSAGQVLPVWTPGHTIEEGVGVVEVPQNLHTGPGGWIPESYGTMTLQHRPQCALLAIPQPNSCVPTTTGQRASIRTPGQGLHPFGMLLKRLETASTGQVPQLDGAIPARAGESAAVWGKGQSPYPVAMLREDLGAASRPGRLPLPEPNRAREVSTGEQVPIRAPGQRENRAGMQQLLKEGAQLRVPEPDGGIQSPTGEQAAIGGEGQAGGALRLPARPEQGTTLDVPQLDAAIETPAGQRAFVWAEGDGVHLVGMGLPDQV